MKKVIQPETDSGYHTAFKAWVMEKTFKREVAIAVLFFWFIITVKVFWFTEVAAIRSLDSAYGTVTTTIWLYVVAAFGMDWMSKQMGDPRARERMRGMYEDPSGSGRFDRPGGRLGGGQDSYARDTDDPIMDRRKPRRDVNIPPAQQGPGETDPALPPVGYAER